MSSTRYIALPEPAKHSQMEAGLNKGVAARQVVGGAACEAAPLFNILSSSCSSFGLRRQSSRK
jgi:hypothetical protein